MKYAIKCGHKCEMKQTVRQGSQGYCVLIQRLLKLETRNSKQESHLPWIQTTTDGSAHYLHSRHAAAAAAKVHPIFLPDPKQEDKLAKTSLFLTYFVITLNQEDMVYVHYVHPLNKRVHQILQADRKISF